MLTPLQIIEVAKISQYLAVADLKKGGLLGGGQDLNLPSKIYNIRKSVEWSYRYNSPNTPTDLINTANYLYSICAPYNQQAFFILNGGGGGSVSPITPPVSNVFPIEFIVAASGTPIVNGGSTLSIPSYKGFNVLFNRNGSPQSQVNSQDTYFNWNPVTCIFTCFPAAVTSELFSINPNI